MSAGSFDPVGAVRRTDRRARELYGRLGPTFQGILWTTAAGFVFSILNAILRAMSQAMDPFEAQFLRYLFGLVAMLPLVARAGLRRYRPSGIFGQFWRGFVHTMGLILWFTALPRIPLAEMTAIGFTGPIFIMVGAGLFLGEKMVPARWFAAAIGFAGVVVVVAPKLEGAHGLYSLVMLASSPVFAGSYLITKALTRRDSAEVIVVWQAISVTLFSLPLALVHWVWPGAGQWAWFLLCGALGSLGHYCLTRSFHVTDISATQSVKFLDLIWASLLGYLVFSDVPSRTTIIGGLVIFASTLWIAHREARARRASLR